MANIENICYVTKDFGFENQTLIKFNKINHCNVTLPPYICRMKLTDIQIKEISELKQDGDRAALAKILNCSVETVTRITNGKQDATLQKLKAVVKFYLKRKKDVIKINSELV